MKRRWLPRSHRLVRKHDGGSRRSRRVQPAFAERFTAMLRHANVDSDKIVSREEATGMIEVEARFDDLDINRDGSITREEMIRYIKATFR